MGCGFAHLRRCCSCLHRPRSLNSEQTAHDGLRATLLEAVPSPHRLRHQWPRCLAGIQAPDQHVWRWLYGHRAMTPSDSSQCCVICGAPIPIRRRRGSPQRFCSSSHRFKYDALARRHGHEQLNMGLVTIELLIARERGAHAYAAPSSSDPRSQTSLLWVATPVAKAASLFLVEAAGPLGRLFTLRPCGDRQTSSWGQTGRHRRHLIPVSSSS